MLSAFSALRRAAPAQVRSPTLRTPRYLLKYSGIPARLYRGYCCTTRAKVNDAPLAEKTTSWDATFQRVRSPPSTLTMDGRVVDVAAVEPTSKSLPSPAKLAKQHGIKGVEGKWALIDGTWLWDRQKPLDLASFPQSSIEFIPTGDARINEAIKRTAAFLLSSAILNTSDPQSRFLGWTDGRFDTDFHIDFLFRDGSSPSSPIRHISQTELQGLYEIIRTALACKTTSLRYARISEASATSAPADTLALEMNGHREIIPAAPFIPDPSAFYHITLLGVSATELSLSANANIPLETPLGQQPVTRIHALAVLSAQEQRAWEEREAKAKQSDHRTIGQQQRLFLFHPFSPGSAFMLPHGTRIVNRLLEALRAEYHHLDYSEVMTPLLFSRELWETSGHWDNYREDMFQLEGEGDTQGMGLKPMNCPGHCLIFDSEPRSYRDLPLRLADFSSLHRAEATGALSGLTRVRRFHQDDGHIFCTPEQIEKEIDATLALIRRFYARVGLTDTSFALSTRPTGGSLGTDAEWTHAESALRRSLDASGLAWTLQPGEGAFYGPKIDIQVKDALGRSHQTATIQLDMQLPLRFNLQYTDSSGALVRPVIIHRAVLGSVERMMAILTEHHVGRWPFWLSPRQILILPVSPAHHAEYARRVKNSIEGGFRARAHATPLYIRVDEGGKGESLSRRIRHAHTEGWNLVLVVGNKEIDQGNHVNVRVRVGEPDTIIASLEGSHPVETIVQGTLKAMGVE